MYKTNYCPECRANLPLEYIESKQEACCTSCGREFDYYYDKARDCCVLEYEEAVIDFHFPSTNVS